MHHKFPIFKTDCLLLREINELDLEHVFKGLSNPKITKHYGVHFETLEATKEQMTWFADKAQMWWAICDLNTKTFYGAAGLNNIDYKNHKAEIGLWLLPEFWGKGIMKTVLPLIVNYGLHTLKLKRIEGFVETENSNCKNAMSKLDFQLENTIQEWDERQQKSIPIDVYTKTR